MCELTFAYGSYEYNIMAQNNIIIIQSFWIKVRDQIAEGGL